MRRPHPERVNAACAEHAYEVARAAESDPRRARQNAFSEYIVAHFRATGQLAPGCDARDFYAWLDGHRAEREAGG